MKESITCKRWSSLPTVRATCMLTHVAAALAGRHIKCLNDVGGVPTVRSGCSRIGSIKAAGAGGLRTLGGYGK